MTTEAGTDGRDVAALIANGVSIAFNRKLTMPSLTKAIVGEFNRAAGNGTDAGRVLAKLVDDMEQDDAVSDFEALLAPLDRIGAQLRELTSLSNLGQAASSDVDRSLKGAIEFLEATRRLGVSHALEVIDERAYADHGRLGVVQEFLREVLRVGPRRRARVAVANLNYDSLALSSLFDVTNGDLCDMANGQASARVHVDVIGDGSRIYGQQLRSVEDLAGPFVSSRRAVLLHLHGSVAWLRSPVDDRVYRFRMDDLRGDAVLGKTSYWESYRAGHTNWSPVVVLANQTTKGALVAEAPFAPAYDAFQRELRDAQRWLIAGYSFRDRCVNDLLARAWRGARHLPKVMVVLHGDSVPDEQVLAAIGYEEGWDPAPEDWLTINRDGIEAAPHSDKWVRWAS